MFFIFKPLNTINPDKSYYNLNLDYRKCLEKPYKYFVWRNYAFIWVILFLVIDFLLNIFNYINLKNKLLINHNITELNNTKFLSEKENIENFKNIYIMLSIFLVKKVDDYLLLYLVIPVVFMLMEFFLILLSIYYRKKWITSKNYIIKSSYVSISWIYLLFLIPLTLLLKLKTSSEIFRSYIDMFIILNLLKEIIPIIYNLFLGIIWSALNFKLLFPGNLYIGQIYAVITNIYFFSIGFILLIFVQISRNYLITFFIFCLLLSVFIPKILFSRYLKYIYTDNEDNEEINEIVLSMRLIHNIFLGIGILLLTIYLLMNKTVNKDNFLMNKLFVIQFIVKLMYRNIYFKILMGDIILSRLLFLEKYHDLYKNELNNYNQEMRKIERELYIEKSNLNFI